MSTQTLIHAALAKLRRSDRGLLRRVAVIMALALGSLGMATAGLAVAASGLISPASDGKVYVCYGTDSGLMRLVGKAASCRKGERRLAWNQSGRPGENGKDGKAGAQGVAGPAGPSTGPAGGVLGGNFPNPSFEAGINKLVPVALVRIDAAGVILNEVHRLPVTGPPTIVQHTPGQGDFTMNFPGLTFASTDAVFCQITGDLATLSGEIRAGPSINFAGRVFIGVATPAGTVLDRAFQCAVYDL
jgi:hypothetical protein